jgi:hypothetical protein
MMHITSTYSAFGRIIMDTGAMGAEHVSRVLMSKVCHRMTFMKPC